MHAIRSGTPGIARHVVLVAVLCAHTLPAGPLLSSDPGGSRREEAPFNAERGTRSTERKSEPPYAGCHGMARIPAGAYRPLFRGEAEAKEEPVASFLLDVSPVTNGQFLEFVRANPKWRRAQVKRLFADEGYLRHWRGDLEPGGEAEEARPVTNVSWFAARAYAAWAGKRLPATAEWEYAAGAGFTRADGASDPEFKQALARWYATPSPETLPPADTGRTNHFGVRNLHGLVWEWTSDFNSAIVTGDARGDTGLERQLFCGSGSLGAADRENFPAFMRFGFRSSLKAGYTVHNLGFRCAKDL